MLLGLNDSDSQFSEIIEKDRFDSFNRYASLDFLFIKFYQWTCDLSSVEDAEPLEAKHITVTSVIPPAPPLPPSFKTKAPISELQGRAKTVRIGKVRWPPPLKEKETFEKELARYAYELTHIDSLNVT